MKAKQNNNRPRFYQRLPLFPGMWFLFSSALLLVTLPLFAGSGAPGAAATASAKPLPQASTQDPSQLKIAFLAGRPSHGYGAHEHYAGSVLLAKTLESSFPGLQTRVFQYDWPNEDLSGYDAIVMYSDGGRGHPVNKRLDEVQKLVDQQIGIVCLHYAVEVPKGEPGERFLDWIGGYFETDWSVNPHWTANFTELPQHPITRGVEPFEIQDEWYYHMRFREAMEGVTPILTAIPPAETLSRPDGPHSGNPHVRQKLGQPQHVAWALQRKDGGRGFGFTGGHFHWNWGNRNFRKLVANAIVWTAGGQVPQQGVDLEALEIKQLKENQDFPEPENFDDDRIKNRIQDHDGR